MPRGAVYVYDRYSASPVYLIENARPSAISGMCLAIMRPIGGR